MELTFLGTSAGVPTKYRNVSGLAIRHGPARGWYLVDCGEGTQHQLLRTRLTLHQLRAVFITHVHGDHSYGLPGLLSSASMSGRTEPLALIAPAEIHAFVEHAIRLTDSKLSFPLQFFATGPEDFKWEDGAFSVSTVALSHRVPCHAFVFAEKNLERRLLTDKLRDEGIEANENWGRLQRGEDVSLADGRALRSADYTAVDRKARKLIVAGDNDTPQLLAAAGQGAHLLVHEATYTQEVSDRVGPAPRHSSAAQVASFAQQAGLPALVLTHFSSRYQMSPNGDPSIAELETEARTHYSGNLHLGRDLGTFALGRDLILVHISGTNPSANE